MLSIQPQETNESVLVVVKRDASGDKAVPNGRRVSEAIDRMQSDNPRVFKPRAAFDGVKNLFMTKELEQAQVSTMFESLNSYSQVTQFNVNMGNPNKTTGIYSVRLTLVGKINPRYVR